MKKYAKDVLEYYIEFAKVDSKLACMNDGRDFQYLSILFGQLSNIFEDSFSKSDSIKIFHLYIDFIITYYNALKKIHNINHTKHYDLFKEKVEKFKNDDDIDAVIVSIRYLKSDIAELEIGSTNYVATTIRTAKPKAFQTNNEINNKKVEAASTHYQKLFKIYAEYNTIIKTLNDNHQLAKIKILRSQV